MLGLCDVCHCNLCPRGTHLPTVYLCKPTCNIWRSIWSQIQTRWDPSWAFHSRGSQSSEIPKIKPFQFWVSKWCSPILRETKHNGSLCMLFFLVRLPSFWLQGNASGLDGIGTLNATKSLRFSFTLPLLLRRREATWGSVSGSHHS